MPPSGRRENFTSRTPSRQTHSRHRRADRAGNVEAARANHATARRSEVTVFQKRGCLQPGSGGLGKGDLRNALLENGHPLKRSPTAAIALRKSKMLIDDFWSSVDRREQSKCWVWTRGKLPEGYGQLRVHGRNILAHRHAWELTNGPIPTYRLVLHACDNPSCCNPAHLFLGSQRDNVRDMIEKGRRPCFSVYHIGEKNSRAKLTDVLAIRKEAEIGATSTILGPKYNVAPRTIRDIVSRKTWR